MLTEAQLKPILRLTPNVFFLDTDSAEEALRRAVSLASALELPYRGTPGDGRFKDRDCGSVTPKVERP